MSCTNLSARTARVGYARACFVYDEPGSDRTEEEKILEALAILREAGDRFWAGELLVRLGFMAALRNEYEKAKVLLGGMAGIEQGDRRSGWHWRLGCIA